MRVILDECLPKRLAREIPGHNVLTSPMAGWSGIKNGELLRRISGNFDVFITIDGNLTHQNSVISLPFAVVVLRAPSNKIEELRPLIPEILTALSFTKPGQISRVPNL